MELFDVAGMCRAVVLKLVRSILKTCNGFKRGLFKASSHGSAKACSV